MTHLSRRGVDARVIRLVGALLLLAAAAGAQNATPLQLGGAAAYEAPAGTIPKAVATGVFNASNGLLDFAVLLENPNGAGDEVDIFQGQADGSFASTAVVSLGAGVRGNAIAGGGFRSATTFDLAVATNSGIVYLTNDGSGNFSLSASAITATGGFAALAVADLDGNGFSDLAAIPNGAGAFTVFLAPNGGGLPSGAGTAYPAAQTGYRCSAIVGGSFTSPSNGRVDLALVCGPISFDALYIFPNQGSGTFGPAPSQQISLNGTSGGLAAGEFDNLPALFWTNTSQAIQAFQSDGSGTFAAVSLVPQGGSPLGSALTVLNSSGTSSIEFAYLDASNSLEVSSYSNFSGSGGTFNGTWQASGALSPPEQALASGYSPNLASPGYVVIGAGVHAGSFPIFQSFTDERSIDVYVLNAAGAVGGTATLYPGTGRNGYNFPPGFATGDFNGDGKTDLAVLGGDLATGEPNFTVYLANASGALPTTTTVPVTTVANASLSYSGADAEVAGNFGPSSNSDLALFGADTVVVMGANGDGTFTPTYSYNLSAAPGYPGYNYRPSTPGAGAQPQMFAFDVNGDGKADLVLVLPENGNNCNNDGTGDSLGAVYVFLGKGDGTFANPVYVAPPVVNPVAGAADFFFQGKQPDLALVDGGELCSGNTAAQGGAAVGILQNNGGMLVAPTNPTLLSQAVGTPYPNFSAVASADINGDGLPDLVVAGSQGVQVLLNTAGQAGSFTPQPAQPLYAGDSIPGPNCNAGGNYAGCVSYDPVLATGKFYGSALPDVVALANGVAYAYQNVKGQLLPPTVGTVAGVDSNLAAAGTAPVGGSPGVLVSTSQGAALLVNNGVASSSATSTTITVTGLAATAVYPGPGTLTAAVTWTGGSVAGGSVTFSLCPATGACASPVQLMAASVQGGTASASGAIPVGSYLVSASYSGSGSFAASTTAGTVPLQVTAAPTAVSASFTEATNTYPGPVSFSATVANSNNASAPVAEGSVGFIVGTAGAACSVSAYVATATVQNGAASVSGVVVGAGSGLTVTACYSDASGNFQSSQGADATSYTLGKAPTTLTLAVSGGVASGASITPLVLTGTVSTTATLGNAPNPSGTITFYSNGIAIPGGAVALSSNAGVLSPVLAPSATPYAITASYSGDSNFESANVTTPQDATVQYLISANPSSLTASGGESVTTTLTVTTPNGFSAPITFTCPSTLPAYVHCGFSPNPIPTTLAGAGDSASTVLTITVDATVAGLPPPGGFDLAMAWPLALLGLLPLGWRKRRGRRGGWALAVVLGLALGGGLVGCGSSAAPNLGGGGTPPPAGAVPIAIGANMTGGSLPALNLTLTILN
ncbi:MAG TPA: FG-GAP-like repeat-containing protein [Terriglobales bacterium]|nr:FG-GAP-like repeat-containing protein [Terriglobales bacterium]